LRLLLVASKVAHPSSRASHRSITKAQRELEREKNKLRQQEAKLKNDIKRSAKEGNMTSAQILAKVSLIPHRLM